MNGTSLCIFKSCTQTHFVRAAATAASLIIVFALVFLVGPAAQAQTYTIIHNFTGGGDGANPYTGLTMDAAGNFYGTTSGGGASYGIVFKLKHSGSGWILSPVHSFAGGADGWFPWARVAIATDGTIYGSTSTSSGDGCHEGSTCGTVFHLRPSPTAPKSVLTPWNETVIYRFTGANDGAYPRGDLVFDQLGNLYGTTVNGGSTGSGVIYKLAPSVGNWTETVLYSAQNNGDGANPFGGVVFDRSGNLYGVFSQGGPHGFGAVYELSPSGSGWTEQTLYGFNYVTDGTYPEGGLIIDSSGNLYGTTLDGGSGQGGTVFELTHGSGGWAFNVIYSFSGPYDGGPWDKLSMDTAGSLYGATRADGAYGFGSIFRLTPSSGGWTYTSLHDFCGPAPPSTDGASPIGNLVLDANHNLYGTTAYGGQFGFGVVFKITP
jgi:uncharacterized repeat protein (TIGR03803 family)